MSQKKTKPIEAVVELARLATKSPSFQFLADPAEDVYSLHDGHPLQLRLA